MPKKQKSNCYRCTHFYITWEQEFPYGCRTMGFKSRQLPCTVVLNSSGKECMFFKRKSTKTPD